MPGQVSAAFQVQLTYLCPLCALFIYLRVLSLSLCVCTYNMITHLISTCTGCQICREWEREREEEWESKASSDPACVSVCVCCWGCKLCEGCSISICHLSPSHTHTHTRTSRSTCEACWQPAAHLFAFSLRQTLDSYASTSETKRESDNRVPPKQ